MTKPMTKIDKLYNLLSDGKNHPIKSIKKRTGLGSVSAAVRDLRAEGHTIYMNRAGWYKATVNSYRMAAA